MNAARHRKLAITCPKCMRDDESLVVSEHIEMEGFAVIRSYSCACEHKFETWEIVGNVIRHFGPARLKIIAQAVIRGIESRSLAASRKKQVSRLVKHGLSNSAMAREMNISHQRVKQIRKELEI